MYFIYAVAGMNLLCQVPYGEFINEQANFKTFLTSMITLFRMSTGESWNGLMHDSYEVRPGEFNKPAAVLFFVSFTVVSSLLLLNVFVAVVLQSFEREMNREEAELRSEGPPINSRHLLDFSHAWTDIEDGEYMHVTNVHRFVNTLSPPLGLRGNPLSGKQMIRFLFEIDVPLSGQRVHFVDLCLALTTEIFNQHGRSIGMNGNVSAIPEESEVMKMIRAQLWRTFPQLKRDKESKIQINSAAEFTAAVSVQRWWRLQQEGQQALVLANSQR